MGAATLIGLTLGGLSAASSFAQAENTRKSQLFAAETAAQQATLMQRQALAERQKGEAEKAKIDAGKSALTARYKNAQSENQALLAASGVEASTGSAKDLLTGTAATYADAAGENAWQRALSGWLANEKIQEYQYNAKNLLAESAWKKKTAGSLGQSLLTATRSGIANTLYGYSSMGSLQDIFSTPRP